MPELSTVLSQEVYTLVWVASDPVTPNSSRMTGLPTVFWMLAWLVIQVLPQEVGSADGTPVRHEDELRFRRGVGLLTVSRVEMKCTKIDVCQLKIGLEVQAVGTRISGRTVTTRQSKALVANRNCKWGGRLALYRPLVRYIAY